MQEDFEVLDNDSPQPIVLFQNETQPITVVVMLDTSGSMTANIALLKAAAEQFLIRLFPRTKRESALSTTRSRSAQASRMTATIWSAHQGPRLRKRHAALGCAWQRASTSSRARRPPRRARLHRRRRHGEPRRLGNGHRSRARRRSDDVRHRAGEHVLRWPTRGTQQARRRVAALADETGGGYFELKQTADLAPTFTQVAQELHSQYVLAFTPTALDGRVHKLSVRVKKPGLTARARRSYLAVAEKPVDNPGPAQR